MLRMKHYTTIFFDWGGVIATDPGDRFLSDLLRSIGATEQQIGEIFETYMKRFMRGELTEQAYWQELRSHYGLSIQDNISEEFKKWRGLVANKDVLNLAQSAKKAGYTIAVLSNVIEPTYNAIKASGYYDMFDEVIASFQVGMAKPEEGIYRLALERTGATAEQSIFIDDQQRCLDPAIVMGFTTVLATSPEQIVRDVQSYLWP